MSQDQNMTHSRQYLFSAAAGAASLAALVSLMPPSTVRAAQPAELRLATTTSTADTGLLSAIVPEFERGCQCRVQVVAVGTGQAIEIGRRGDADVLLVHDRAAEEAFLAEGHAKTRTAVMSNDFVVVGPKGDPAGAASAMRAAEAFRLIAKARQRFVSRGDRSGTNTREQLLWRAGGPEPSTSEEWYQSVGQGMGETLVFANERGAYTLSDRATWLAMRARLPRLEVVVGGSRPSENTDPALLNMYSVIVVDATRHPGVRQDLASAFAAWLLAADTQRRIEAFGRERYGQPLFYGQAESMRVTREVTVRIGSRARTFSLAELRKLPRAVLNDYTVLGVKRGIVGTFSFAGASLADVLKAVDPSIAQAGRAAARILIVSRDGWTSTLKWGEVFGALPAGEALYGIKGCNECHGADGEGSAPDGKRPVPAIAGGSAKPFEMLRDILRAGGARHGGLNSYTAAQLADPELRQLAGWLSRTAQPNGPPLVIDRARRVVMLAYERDGSPLEGAGGLIQLVVGPDQFAGRYSHWVSAIYVQ
jgi:tungstate transport system substrate-binding protein